MIKRSFAAFIHRRRDGRAGRTRCYSAHDGASDRDAGRNGEAVRYLATLAALAFGGYGLSTRVRMQEFLLAPSCKTTL